MPTALELFTAVPRLHNCAQSVAAAKGGSKELMAQLATQNAGRAPDGLCGALYAALQFVPEDRRQGVIDAFGAELGETHCHALKKMGVPCTKCVETAERLAE
ncbi:MAG: hypothetical protein J5833_04080 [Victivallales bacterium]|nr:hypothetical protein [Victivallales bacterium]